MNSAIKMTQGSDNVFTDLGFNKVQAEYMLRRIDLMNAVEKWFIKSGLTQATASKMLGTTQPRFNQLLKGKADIFSIDALVTMLAHAGMSVKMTIKESSAVTAI